MKIQNADREVDLSDLIARASEKIASEHRYTLANGSIETYDESRLAYAISEGIADYFESLLTEDPEWLLNGFASWQIAKQIRKVETVIEISLPSAA